MADQKLNNERWLTQSGQWLFIVGALTGLVLFMPLPHSLALQLVLLTHLLFGLGFTLLALPYVPFHFVRTAYFRRPTLILTGLLLVAVIVVVAWSGLSMIWFGQQQAQPHVPFLHQLAGVLVILLAVLHGLDHYFRMPQVRKQQYPNRFLALNLNSFRRCSLIGLVAALVAIGAVFLFPLNPSPATAAVTPYQYDYGDHPFRPSQTETVHGGFVSEIEIAGSEGCAECHQDIAKQWAQSLHKQAASDPTYVTNVNLLEGKQGISATRYCEGCHAPVALLTGELTEGGQHGGVKGTVSNAEGVSCMSCHGVSRMIHLKGVASYEFTPRAPYLFEHSTNAVARSVARLLLNADPDQHRKDLSPQILRDPAMCAGCHAQFMDEDMNGWGWVKMQDDYSAWLKGPFSGHESEFASRRMQRCHDCHMPKVKSNDPAADEMGKVASHHFPGGNTIVPLLAGDEQQYQATVNMLQNNGLRLTIDKPNRMDAQQDLRSLDESIRGHQEAPYYAYLNESIRLDVIVANQGVGHDFPAGTTDLGEAWIELVVHDADGDVVYSSGQTTLGSAVPEGTHVYKSIPIDRQGNEVWRHDLFNMVGESFRRVVKAGEADLANYEFRIPTWAKSPLQVSATLQYRKLNERYARFALGSRYRPIPIVTVAANSLEIPLRIRTEIDQVDQKITIAH